MTLPVVYLSYQQAIEAVLWGGVPVFDRHQLEIARTLEEPGRRLLLVYEPGGPYAGDGGGPAISVRPPWAWPTDAHTKKWILTAVYHLNAARDRIAALWPTSGKPWLVGILEIAMTVFDRRVCDVALRSASVRAPDRSGDAGRPDAELVTTLTGMIGTATVGATETPEQFIDELVASARRALVTLPKIWEADQREEGPHQPWSRARARALAAMLNAGATPNALWAMAPWELQWWYDAIGYDAADPRRPQPTRCWAFPCGTAATVCGRRLADLRDEACGIARRPCPAGEHPDLRTACAARAMRPEHFDSSGNLRDFGGYLAALAPVRIHRNVDGSTSCADASGKVITEDEAAALAAVELIKKTADRSLRDQEVRQMDETTAALEAKVEQICAWQSVGALLPPGPIAPRGKVPLSVTDPDAQDLLWEYARRHRERDAAFSDDLEEALRRAGAATPTHGAIGAALPASDALRVAQEDATHFEEKCTELEEQLAQIRFDLFRALHGRAPAHVDIAPHDFFAASFARIAELAAPLPGRIPCPECGELHIDEGDFATKPHHTHACQHCGAVWRPFKVATVGVRFLPGFKNGESK